MNDIIEIDAEVSEEDPTEAFDAIRFEQLLEHVVSGPGVTRGRLKAYLIPSGTPAINVLRLVMKEHLHGATLAELAAVTEALPHMPASVALMAAGTHVEGATERHSAVAQVLVGGFRVLGFCRLEQLENQADMTYRVFVS